jgi:hypothetical protein
MQTKQTSCEEMQLNTWKSTSTWILASLMNYSQLISIYFMNRLVNNVLYSRLDIYPNRDSFYIQARPATVNHQSRECKDKTPQAQVKRSARCHTHDLHKRTQNKNPGLRANSKILYSTIEGDGSANAYADVVY